MHKAEADWIVSKLSTIDPAQLSPMLNIGSSTLEFRTKTQPWIDSALIKPLEARGIRIIHVDLKSAPGVDIVADLTTDEGFDALAKLGARSIMVCNVLEHVLDPRSFANRCANLVGPKGYVVVTVPHSYPHHRDPIDTMIVRRRTRRRSCSTTRACLPARSSKRDPIAITFELARGFSRVQSFARHFRSWGGRNGSGRWESFIGWFIRA